MWLSTLRRRHRALLSRVANEGLFLLVPQSSSLESAATVGAGDVLHHVIRPASDGGRGNHVTLSGRKVIVSSGEVIADAGFPRQVSATVLGTSRVLVNRRTGDLVRSQRSGTAAPPETLALNIYFISRPLDGGLPGPAAPDELDHGAILAAVAMLRSSPETELVFQHLSALVARVRARCVRVGRFTEADLDSIQAELHAEWFAAARALAQTSFYAGESRDALLSAVAQLSQTVESWCMEQLAEPLLARTVEVAAAQCSSLRPCILSHAGKSPADFGVKAKIRCNLSASVGCLALVHTAATPLEKLHCLRDTVTLTIKCVTRHLEDAGVDLDDVELGSDDILDMLLYIITQANEGTDMAELPGEQPQLARACRWCSRDGFLKHPGHLDFAYRFHFVPRGDFETSRLVSAPLPRGDFATPRLVSHASLPQC